MRVMVFPGQGSQKVGMGRALADHPEAKLVYDEVSEAINLDIRSLMWESDEETLRQTENAQVALFASSVAALRASGEGDFSFAAGHSVGEYAALVSANVLDLASGARLVRTRGELMATAGEAHPGTMAAVLGLDPEQLEAVCNATDGVVVIANYNCPGQYVISGEIAAVKAAGESAVAAGAKRVLPLSVSGAFHSPLMAEPAAKMRVALDAANFQKGDVPVVCNVEALPRQDGWPEILERQLKSPVRWTESVEWLISQGATEFVEFGSGQVLGGLIKRISREVSTAAVGD